MFSCKNLNEPQNIQTFCLSGVIIKLLKNCEDHENCEMIMKM